VKWTVNVGYFDKKMYFAAYIYKIKVFAFHKKISKKTKAKKTMEYTHVMEFINKTTKEFKSKKAMFDESLRLINRKIRVKSYSVFIDVGVGNPALTGIACGAASALLGLIGGFIGNILTIEEKCEMVVHPQHNKIMFDIGGNVVIKFRVVKLLKLWSELRKIGLLN
jgi:hypothetical protein